MKHETNPAKRIVRLLGGARTVSEIAGVDITRVYRWERRPGALGRVGVIPDMHHDSLIAAAAERGIALTRDDFYGPAPEKPDADASAEGEAARPAQTSAA